MARGRKATPKKGAATKADEKEEEAMQKLNIKEGEEAQSADAESEETKAEEEPMEAAEAGAGDAEGEQAKDDEENGEEADGEKEDEQEEEGDEEEAEGDEKEEEDEKDEEEKEKEREEEKKRLLGPFVPSRMEFKQDKLYVQHMCTVVVGPCSHLDMLTPKIQEQTKLADQFFIRFHKNAEGISEGHIELRFESPSEAVAAEEALSGVREELIAKQLTPDFLKEDTYITLTKMDTGHGKREMNSATIPGLGADVTEAEVKEAFPDCVQVWIPTMESGESKGYAYVEYEDEKSMQAAIDKEAEIKGEKVKVHKIGFVPLTLGVLFKQMDKEFIKNPLQDPLHAQRLLRFQQMLRVAEHYYSQPDLPDKKKNLLGRKISMMNKRLKEHKHLQEAQLKRLSKQSARGGGRRGGRDGGGRDGGGRKFNDRKGGRDGGRNKGGNRNQGYGGGGGGGRNRNQGGYGGGGFGGGGFGGNMGGGFGNMGGGFGNMGGGYGNMGGGGFGSGYGGNMGGGFGNMGGGGFGGGMGGGYGGGGNRNYGGNMGKRRRMDQY